MRGSIVRQLDVITEKCPSNVAVSWEDGEISFFDLQFKSRKLALGIIDRMQEMNSPIAYYLPKSVEALETMYGILYTGNYYCPVPYGSPAERIIKIYTTLKPSMVIAFEKDRLFLEQLLNVVVVSLESLLETAVSEMTLIDARIEKVIDTDPVYVLFTSGSTGTPKGVVLPHRAVADYIEWHVEKYDFDEKTVLASQAPFHFDASMPDVFSILYTGGRLHLIPESDYLLPARLIDKLNKARVNTLIWVPSALIRLVTTRVIEKQIITDLRCVIFCGEVMPVKYLNYWKKIYPDTVFVNMYGPTEAAYACTYYIVEKSMNDDEALPLGRACENERVFLISDGRIVEGIGEKGELCIEGSCLALGYYNYENGAFCQLSNWDAYTRTIYHTGDLGYYNADGELCYAGRMDSQIKHNGYRIELGEIESAVISLSFIKEACVLYENSRQEIVLLFTADQAVDNKEIMKKLATIIPKYMYPSKYIQLEEMPINHNGKIDRLVLKEKLGVFYEHN